MKRTADYLNEIARESDLFYELSATERVALKNCLLGMYDDISQVCQKYNLSLMLGGGSVLGAVRHKGFIPWDDDLDLMLSREDFEVFTAVYEKELADKYELSVPRSKKESKTLFMQLIKKGTTLVCADDLCRTDSNGIRVDLYAIERMPDNKSLRYFKCSCLDLLRICAISTNIYQTENKLFKLSFSYSLRSRIYYYIRYTLGFFCSILGRKRLYDLFDRFASSSKGNLYCTIPTGRRMSRGEQQKRCVFFPVRTAEFEGRKVAIPNDYDAYLRNLYGDYMTVPPVNKRERHFYVSFDLGEL